jgi:hypothetical protein
VDLHPLARQVRRSLLSATAGDWPDVRMPRPGFQACAAPALPDACLERRCVCTDGSAAAQRSKTRPRRRLHETSIEACQITGGSMAALRVVSSSSSRNDDRSELRYGKGDILLRWIVKKSLEACRSTD